MDRQTDVQTDETYRNRHLPVEGEPFAAFNRRRIQVSRHTDRRTDGHTGRQTETVTITSDDRRLNREGGVGVGGRVSKHNSIKVVVGTKKLNVKLECRLEFCVNVI